MLYDLTYLINPDLTEDQVKKTSQAVNKMIKTNSGREKTSQVWGRKKLTYPLQKHRYAFYISAVFDAPPEKISKIEKALKLNKDIIRFLIVKYETPTPTARKEQPQTKAATTGEAETQTKKAPSAKAAKSTKAPTSESEKQEVKADLADLDKKLDEILKDE